MLLTGVDAIIPTTAAHASALMAAAKLERAAVPVDQGLCSCGRCNCFLIGLLLMHGSAVLILVAACELTLIN